MSAFNSDGFTTGSYGGTNSTGTNYASWTFKKQAKFFDVVTYTGTGVNGRTVSHSLGSVPGMIIIKQTSAAGEPWYVQHRYDTTKKLLLSGTNAASDGDDGFQNTAPTSSVFTVAYNGTNKSGDTYVAYLFAHDTASDSRVKCGSYTGGGNSDVEVNLGWKPQWLLIRRSDAAEDWFILDTARGLGSDGDPNAKLELNLTDAETSSSTSVAVTDTGFFTTSNTGAFNASGGNYIYMAIRASTSTDSAITWPSSVKWPAGVAPTTPAAGTKDLFTFRTTDGGTTYFGKKAAEGLA